MLTSKLTSKYQATIPKEVRRALHLEAGDTISYIIKNDNTVVITRVDSYNLEHLSSFSKNLGEWNSEEDENAFRKL